MLSTLATVLALIWFGNIIMSVMLRDAASPERFAWLVPTGLFVYALWHVTKTAFARPEDAIEWTSAERELLGGGPFERRELIFYRLASILNATLLKAACFTLLMLPDLRQPVAGFIGALLALIFLDVLRVNVEIAVHGISERTYRRFRLAMGSLSATVIISSLVIAFSTLPNLRTQSTHMTWAIMWHVLRSAAQLLETLPGQIAMAPFQWFAHVITTEQLSIVWLSWLVTCLLVVVGMTGLMVHLDRWFDERLVRRERREYPPRPITGRVKTRASVGLNRHGRIAWLTGAGPIAWRQLIGANRQRNQLAVALGLPGVLATLPILVCRDGKEAALQVTAALAFYSFLLLPTALKFDFRRDIQRMVILKTLPIRPLSVVVGQVITPTLLAFALQATVLIVTMIVRPFPFWMLIATLVLLAPLNALIFAIDNLLYLLYPYRLNQEGIEIFLRTTLTFTAKGLIFTIGLLMTLAWSIMAHAIALQLPQGLQYSAMVFVVGGWAMLCLTTFAAIQLLARIFVRFDPSQDTPA